MNWNNFKNRISSQDFVSKNIDILRGIAILLVIWVHTSNMLSLMDVNARHSENPALFSFVTSIMSFGASGVGLFFFISGFLIHMLYWKNINYKSYTIRRAGRIFPLWAFWLAVSTLVATLGIRWWFYGTEHGKTMTGFLYGSGYDINNPNNWVLILVYLIFLGFLTPAVYNWVVPGGWSIQTEIYHYTLFPFLRKIGITLSITFALLLQIIFVLFTYGKPETPELAIISAYITGPIWFIAGMLASQSIKFIQTKNDSFKVKRIDWLLMGLTLSVSFMVKINPNHSIDTFKTLIVIILSIYASSLIYKNVIFTNVMSRIGKYSYGMYFSHFITMPFFSYITTIWLFSNSINGRINFVQSMLGILFIFIASLITSYLIALCTYYAFEKRVLLWSRRY